MSWRCAVSDGWIWRRHGTYLLVENNGSKTYSFWWVSARTWFTRRITRQHVTSRHAVLRIHLLVAVRICHCVRTRTRCLITRTDIQKHTQTAMNAFIRIVNNVRLRDLGFPSFYFENDGTVCIIMIIYGHSEQTFAEEDDVISACAYT